MPGLGGAADAGHRGRPGRKAFLPDRLPAPFAHPVPAGFQPLQRLVDRAQLFPRRVKQRGGVLPLEGERGSFGVVLVVGPGRARLRANSRCSAAIRCPARVRSSRSSSAWASSRAVLILSDLSRPRFDLRCG
jgi:hypothetical protein